MTGPARTLVRAALCAAAALAIAAGEARAQSVSKNLQRSFNGEPYQASYSFFTAQATEAAIDFSRLTGTCQDVPDPCTSDSQCLSGVCYPLGQICIGQVYVYPKLGQVSVLTKAEFCRAAVCGASGGGYLPPECDPAQYPCTTPCPNPSDCSTCTTARALCLCSDGFLCPANDAVYGPGGAVFDETFTSAPGSNTWTLSHASVHPGGDGFLELGEDTFTDPAAFNAVALASARVPLVPGQEYVLVFKHSFDPFVPGLLCQPYGILQAHLEGRPPVCDSDLDGSPVDQDCQDGNPAIRPGLPDAICNGIDENCAGGPDDQFVEEVDRWTPHAVSGQPTGRSGHTLILAGTRVVAWGGSVSGTATGTGAAYEPAADAWQATPAGPAARASHTAVWTGSRMIVWGGASTPTTLLNSGGLYDPVANSWTGATTTTGAPSARAGHIAVWTGSRMIVWGGLGSGGLFLANGALYDPVGNSWTGMSASPLAGRHSHTAVWTGDRLVIWGGQTSGGPTDTGAIYDPKTDLWLSTSPGHAPSARFDHTMVAVGGDELLVWGGRNAAGQRTNTGARLRVSGNAWTTMTTIAAPAARSQHGAVWTGSEMIVWGGGDGSSDLVEGARYHPGSDRWFGLTTLGDPVPRTLPGAVWIPSVSRMLVWGGLRGTISLSTGGLYSPGWTCGLGACARSTSTLCSGGVISYGCTPGDPVSEDCNGLDDDCDGLTDNGVLPVFGSPLDLTASGGATATLAWEGVPNGQAGDVVWGSVTALRSTDGNYATSTGGCLANDDVDRSVVAAPFPVVGEAFWYLVREVNLCAGPGTYDEGEPSQAAPRDAGIAASGVACP